MRRIFTSGRWAAAASTLALVVALSGAAYAANTVRSIDIVDGAVRSADLRNGDVQSIDVANNSLTDTDVADGGLTGFDLAAGSVFNTSINETSFGASPRLFARVFEDGTLGAGHGVSSAGVSTTGVFDVTFTQDVSQCSFAVTPFDNQPRYGVVSSSGVVVTVRTYNAAGTPTTVAFDIVAFC